MDLQDKGFTPNFTVVLEKSGPGFTPGISFGLSLNLPPGLTYRSGSNTGGLFN